MRCLRSTGGLGGVGDGGGDSSERESVGRGEERRAESSARESSEQEGGESRRTIRISCSPTETRQTRTPGSASSRSTACGTPCGSSPTEPCRRSRRCLAPCGSHPLCHLPDPTTARRGLARACALHGLYSMLVAFCVLCDVTFHDSDLLAAPPQPAPHAAAEKMAGLRRYRRLLCRVEW